MRTPIFRAGAPLPRLVLLAVAAAAMLAGCGSVSQVTKERVARSESSLQQAQQAVGRSEAGAVELQRARDNLEQAKAALDKKEGEKAERYAQLAQLDADLAMAKSQSAAARKAADELMASIQTLRQEAARGSTPSER
jgi:septal ring factor EnvC (AmiA/AmiB activator)